MCTARSAAEVEGSLRTEDAADDIALELLKVVTENGDGQSLADDDAETVGTVVMSMLTEDILGDFAGDVMNQCQLSVLKVLGRRDEEDRRSLGTETESMCTARSAAEVEGSLRTEDAADDIALELLKVVTENGDGQSLADDDAETVGTVAMSMCTEDILGDFAGDVTNQCQLAVLKVLEQDDLEIDGAEGSTVEWTPRTEDVVAESCQLLMLDVLRLDEERLQLEKNQQQQPQKRQPKRPVRPQRPQPKRPVRPSRPAGPSRPLSARTLALRAASELEVAQLSEEWLDQATTANTRILSENDRLQQLIADLSKLLEGETSSSLLGIQTALTNLALSVRNTIQAASSRPPSAFQGVGRKLPAVVEETEEEREEELTDGMQTPSVAVDWSEQSSVAEDVAAEMAKRCQQVLFDNLEDAEDASFNSHSSKSASFVGSSSSSEQLPIGALQNFKDAIYAALENVDGVWRIKEVSVASESEGEVASTVEWSPRSIEDQAAEVLEYCQKAVFGALDFETDERMFSSAAAKESKEPMVSSTPSVVDMLETPRSIDDFAAELIDRCRAAVLDRFDAPMPAPVASVPPVVGFFAETRAAREAAEEKETLRLDDGATDVASSIDFTPRSDIEAANEVVERCREIVFAALETAKSRPGSAASILAPLGVRGPRIEEVAAAEVVELCSAAVLATLEADNGKSTWDAEIIARFEDTRQLISNLALAVQQAASASSAASAASDVEWSPRSSEGVASEVIQQCQQAALAALEHAKAAMEAYSDQVMLANCISMAAVDELSDDDDFDDEDVDASLHSSEAAYSFVALCEAEALEGLGQQDMLDRLRREEAKAAVSEVESSSEYASPREHPDVAAEFADGICAAVAAGFTREQQPSEAMSSWSHRSSAILVGGTEEEELVSRVAFQAMGASTASLSVQNLDEPAVAVEEAAVAFSDAAVALSDATASSAADSFAADVAVQLAMQMQPPASPMSIGATFEEEFAAKLVFQAVADDDDDDEDETDEPLADVSSVELSAVDVEVNSPSAETSMNLGTPPFPASPIWPASPMSWPSASPMSLGTSFEEEFSQMLLFQAVDEEDEIEASPAAAQPPPGWPSVVAPAVAVEAEAAHAATAPEEAPAELAPPVPAAPGAVVVEVREGVEAKSWVAVEEARLLPLIGGPRRHRFTDEDFEEVAPNAQESVDEAPVAVTKKVMRRVSFKEVTDDGDALEDKEGGPRPRRVRRITDEAEPPPPEFAAPAAPPSAPESSWSSSSSSSSSALPLSEAEKPAAVARRPAQERPRPPKPSPVEGGTLPQPPARVKTRPRAEYRQKSSEWLNTAQDINERIERENRELQQLVQHAHQIIAGQIPTTHRDRVTARAEASTPLRRPLPQCVAAEWPIAATPDAAKWTDAAAAAEASTRAFAVATAVAAAPEDGEE